MFSGWLPSIFGRRRESEERDEDEDSDDSSRPAPVGKRSKTKSSDSRRSAVEEELLVEKWTVACLNAVMLPAHQDLSNVFAPLPMLALFCIIWMGATDEVRKHMKAVCGIDKRSLRAFSTHLARISAALNKDSLLLYRVLTTPDQIQTIDPIFTTKLHKRFGKRALIPADRDKQRDYIRTSTKRMISDLSIPSSAGLLGFAAAAVVEKWQAETRPYPDRPFALSQREKQAHECFEMRGMMRMLREERIDSCLLPFRDSTFALAILRPSERGGIVRLRSELTAAELHATLKKLGEQKPGVSRVLLPRIELRSAEPSLLPKWRLSGVLSERVRPRRKGGERVCPPFREIAAGASIRIDERGVSTASEERARTRSISTSASSTHSYYSAALDISLDPNFNLRLDSPFLFFVVHAECMTPVLAGTYAGSATITPYTRSVSMKSTKSKSSGSKSFARKSLNVISRPLRKARQSTTSAKETSISEEKKKKNSSDEEKKEFRGVPKCEGCEERYEKSGGKTRREAVPPVQPAAAAAAPAAPAARSVAAAAASTTTSQRSTRAPKRVSVRETLRETHRSTREAANRTVFAARDTTYAAKDGLVAAAKIGGEKIGKGIDSTRQTAVRIAGKSSEKIARASEKAKRASSVVSEKAKSIGRKIKASPIITSLSRSTRSGSRSSEEGEGKTRETTEESEERAAIEVPKKTALSESSSRSKAKTPARPTSSSSKSSKPAAAAAETPKKVVAAAPAPKPAAAAPAKSAESSFEASKATAKAAGKEVARNVKKGLSKAKGSMKKLFGKIGKHSKKEDGSGE